MIKLSLVIPVYNTKRQYLEQCFNIFSDNYNSQIELIIVDDGSNLTTKEYLDTYTSRCKTTIIHQNNSGQNRARLNGLLHACGTYVGFIDSDDYINWNALEYILQRMNYLSSDIIAFSGKIIGKKNNFDYTKNWKEKREYIRNCAPLWLQFYKRDFLISNGLYITDGVAIGEDLASTVTLALKSSSYEYIDVSLYNYRVFNNSVMHSLHTSNRMSIIDVFNYITNNISSSRKYYEEIEWQAIQHLLVSETIAHLKYSYKSVKYAKKLHKYLEQHFPRWRQNKYLKKEMSAKLFLCIHRLYFIIYLVYHFKSILLSRD